MKSGAKEDVLHRSFTCRSIKDRAHQLHIIHMIQCTWNSTRHELDLTFCCRTLKVGSKATTFDATWNIVCNLCSND